MRLSELVATLSLVSDLGMGRPMERALRQTVIAMRLATAAGVAADIRADGTCSDAHDLVIELSAFLDRQSALAKQ